jgi:hypothetical protein
MKKISQPAQPEKADYVSDFSGKKFPFPFPDVQIKFEFNYGSEFDGSKISFDLSDQEASGVLQFIREKLSPKTLRELRRRLKQVSQRYDGNFQARDWQALEYDENNVALLQFLLSIKEQ